MEDHRYSIQAEVLDLEANKIRLREKRKKMEAKKLRDQRRQKTRINIGIAFSSWKALMKERGFQSDAEAARFLLDSFSRRQTCTASRIEWTLSDDSADSASESPSPGEPLMLLHSGVYSNLPKMQDEVTVSTVRQWSKQTTDEQKKPSSEEDEEGKSVYESSYVNLNKEVLVLLMFRCLECSSECLVQGKGKGGNLFLRQECLVCCNYRLWTSQSAEMPKDKVADMCMTDARCDVLNWEQKVHENNPCKQSRVNVNMLQEDEDARGEILSFGVKEENDDGEMEEIHTLKATYEDSFSHFSVKGKNIEDDGFNVTPAENETTKQLYNTTCDLVTDQNKLFTDEDNTVKLAEKANDQSSEEWQPDDLEENLSSSSSNTTDSSEDECVEKEMEWKKPQKLYQNTVKPIIWCVDCGAVAKMACTVRRHQKIYGCADCGLGDGAEISSFKDFSVHFTDINTFHLHALDVHGATANLYEHVICQDCNKSVRVQTDPSQKGHVCEYKIKPFSCQLCRKRFFTEIGQKVHYRRLHGDYTHICKYCMMVFNTKTSKLEHEQKHDDDELPYICPDCPEKFKDFVTRNQHLKSHRGQKKYTCHTCNRKFSALYRYERHMLIHSGEKPYTCEVCERSFNQFGHLKSHLRLHTGEKPFMCEQCGECFNHNISLRNHQLRHHSVDSTAVLSEENKVKGRPVSNTESKDMCKKRARKSSSTTTAAAEELEEEKFQSHPDLKVQEQSHISDFDGQEQKRGHKRKARRKKRMKR